ncbi:hypothetical protein BDQ12DRAFT_689688 [Crucibulum laeve]|uniref:Secreted protein n=1 Tax=Crucibulum laeve TaxID=68775 RepID=A0A5C3LMT7_9AGAR|nr:hypothetical protein BDQ12DRAFT_689688 [Crucibulum laeve]
MHIRGLFLALGVEFLSFTASSSWSNPRAPPITASTPTLNSSSTSMTHFRKLPRNVLTIYNCNTLRCYVSFLIHFCLLVATGRSGHLGSSVDSCAGKTT